MRSFTHNELAQYNGQEGRPAYIGVRGNVYDVSEVPEWKGAEIHGNVFGHDLSDITYQQAAKKYSPVSKLPIIGKLVD
ncbi:cytochrome b5 domain-containing protein [Limosilactobacillus reuteri]|uniref:Cytochrome B5 n=2 Tax=Limosilactobacillus reuteri TaxID=1598 RepID=S5N9N7_LIMRT|nr:cytochrome b5 domain-containing protein [Limosilactobacillus reuteri]AGR63634.1 cytochrome B5 [Limosilactobacillus reuteri TD1]MCC4410789.1 cytochrome B5 [Limosilactobacillus reuteri]MDL2057501.1 cytochrome b5 domain-containing protein [Limosilactobacillus reuteri]MRG74660.1 cytochrome B5 [Limosilactobacillus reuteri]OUL55521.1 cytochrome B5 [Limosilactobacillus reuteri]